MSRRWIGMLMLGALVVGIAPAPRTDAEEKKAAVKPEKLSADLDFVFESGCNFLAVRPNELLDSVPLKLLPQRLKRDLERATDHVKQFLGLTVADLERVTVLLPSSIENDPVFVVRTLKPYDRQAVLNLAVGAEARQEKYRGLTLFSSKEREGITVGTLDAQTFIVGRERGVKEAINQADGRRTPRPHAVAIEWAAAKHHVVLGATPEPIFGLSLLGRGADSSAPASGRTETQPRTEPRPPPDQPERKEKPKPEPLKEKESESAASEEEEFVGLKPVEFERRRPEPDLNEIMDQLPFGALPFKPLLRAESLAVALDVGTETKARWQFTFADTDAANDGEMSARVLLYMMRELIGRLPREMRAHPESSPKLLAVLKDLQAALKAATLQRKGNIVEGGVSLKTDEATVVTFVAEMEKGATRAQAMNNFKMIGLSMHAYHSSMGTLPAAAICDPKGKPLLSWRVAVLPYIEQEDLYRQFKLDEPWDSPNNIKLLDKMPAVYAMPGRDAKKGETFLCVCTGPNTPYDPRLPRPGSGPRFTEFTDGLSNTVLVVEAGAAVPWTKPDDLVIDPKKPLPKLGGSIPDVFLAAFADGSVRTIPLKVDEKTLRNLIDPSDGNAIDWEQLEPGRPRPPRPAKPVEGNKPKLPPPARKPER